MADRRTGNLCPAKGFRNRSSVQSPSFIGYPKEAERRAILMKNCGTKHLADSIMKPNNSFWVCEAHFENETFLNPTVKNKLV